jgi:hypothetical protein
MLKEGLTVLCKSDHAYHRNGTAMDNGSLLLWELKKH